MTRCEFCHEWVDAKQREAHRRDHLGLRPDGQQNEYLTLPPEDRFAGPLDGVPQVYRHGRCGVCTGMPEQIIRTYLKDPFAYDDFSYCAGCQAHVPCRELVWVETGESMQAYNDRLRRGRRRPQFRSLGRVAAVSARAALFLVILGLAVAAAVGWFLVRAGSEP